LQAWKCHHCGCNGDLKTEEKQTRHKSEEERRWASPWQRWEQSGQPWAAEEPSGPQHACEAGGPGEWHVDVRGGAAEVAAGDVAAAEQPCCLDAS
jgi:hypothetical protein